MPVSGNEETGVKPLSRQFSDYSAGVPIKKRKIPTFWPPSPPPKEQSSHNSKDGLLEKCQSGHSQGLVSMTFNISGRTELSTPNNNMMCGEEGKKSVITNAYMQHMNTDRTDVKVEEPNLSVNSVSLSDLANKDNHVGTESFPGMQEMMGKSELGSKYTEFNALSSGRDIYKRPTGDEKCKSEASGLSGITELSLGFKEYHVSDLVGNNMEGQCPSKENTDEPISLDLSLSKGKCGSGVGSNTDGAHLPSSRSKWDLNTTMDVWEDLANPDQSIGNAMDATSQAHVTKTSICTTEGVDTGFVSAHQGVGENKQGIRFQMSPFSTQLWPSGSVLHVGFRPSILQSYFHQECSSSSRKNDSPDVNSNISLPRSLVQPGSGHAGNHSIVKRELVDKCIRQELKVPETNVSKSLDCRKIKHDSDLESGHEAESSKSHMKLVVPKSVKSEPIEGNHDSIEAVKEMSVEAEKQIQGPSNVIAQTSFLYERSTHETVSTASADVSNRSPCTKEDQNRMDLCQKTCDTPLKVGPEPVISSSLNKYERSNVNVTRDAEKGDEKSLSDAENIRLEFISEPCLDSGVNCEASVSDEEKINISGDMLEEDSYGSDYESDGNHGVATAIDGVKDGEEDDFEDGEVRESVHCSAADETLCEKREVKDGVYGNSDDQREDLSHNSGNDFSMVALPDGDETRGNQITKGTMIVHEEKGGTNKDVCLQGSPTIEISKVGNDNNIKVDTQIKSLDQSGREDSPKAKETEMSSDEICDGNQEVVNAVRSKDEIVTSELVKKNDLELPKGEASVNDEDVTKDAVHGGNRSRIIKLSTSIASSPGKTRCTSGRSAQSPGRERIPDPLFEPYRLHPRGRGESYVKREGHFNETSRSSRWNFMNGRGRISSRINSVRGDWESQHSLAPDCYNVQSDGSFVRGGWVGREVVSDQAPNLRHLPSRRRSPNRRFNGHRFRVVRVPRNNSPSRCIGDDGSELLGMRHSQKFMRDCHDDNVDPFEGVDDHFVHGSGNFSSFRRKGLPRIRPNSPIRSRSRSPRPWSSPTRRSPDGFCGRSQLPRRGSPVYRMERIRTCDHPFPQEMVNRRHSSPLYMTRSSNMREDHGYPRSVMHNRSPPNRMIPKDKRFDVVDYRERTDRRDYFCGPIHTSRFQQLADEGNGEERRLTERRGSVRSFRPTYRRRYHD